MRPSAFGSVISTMLFALAACGGGDGSTIGIRGDFRETGDDAPTRVLAVEAQREAEVSAGAFEFPELTAGPVTLLILSGTDTIGTMGIGNLPAGSEVALHGLRIDSETRRAFPATLEGAGMVIVNGLRMGPADRLPRRVDEPGTVLAISEGADAILLRPDDAGMPDLRVVVGPATAVATPDGDPVAAEAIAPGDSVRVLGESGQGLVLADTLTVPRSMALAESGDGDGGASEPSFSGNSDSGADDSGGGGDSGGDGSPAPAVVAPVRRAPVAAARPGRGNDDRPRGQGRVNRGGGGGNGRAKGKKN